ncbi:MAG: MFS transporter [Alphaproteobacteria bacterium]|nr:MFS transporter [Alphaproteobacteria bacterium]
MAVRAQWQLAVVGLGTAAVQLDTAVNIGFPAITRGFGLATAEIRWVVISYVLTYASLLLAFGRLGDRLGHARVFRVGLAWTAAAHLLCAAAASFEALLAARVLQGVGAALVLSGGPALATGLFDEAARTRILGSFAMMVGVAATLGPWIGGALVAHWDWPAVFWFRVPVALLALALFRPGAAAAVAGPAPPPARRLLDVLALRAPGFLAVNVASVVVNFAAFVVWLLVPYFLGRVAGLEPGLGGAVLSMGAVGGILASLAGGRAIGRVAPPRAAAFGALLVAAGLLLGGAWGERSGLALLVATLVLQGIGLALFQLAYTDIVTATLPRGDRGVAGSLTILTRTMGTVGAAALLLPLFEILQADIGFLPAFGALFLGLSALPLAAAILLPWLARR